MAEEDRDPGALSGDQERRLRDYKIQSRLSNEEYLRSHQEVKLLISAFIREVLLKRPENIREFAAGSLVLVVVKSVESDGVPLVFHTDYFTDPKLRDKIQEKMKDNAEP
ncbi:RIIa domain-containing protein 1 isoform X1 [Hyla sarda]|uniref:RIIa domain-containing protein 1 isoform X1 n=1 Tax=Hyla sarda TaxID=327740 RepID=UPI0024C46F17|nr:RIIa domain-containing protein 1 isoform X1 [Hyla sarda]